MAGSSDNVRVCFGLQFVLCRRRGSNSVTIAIDVGSESATKTGIYQDMEHTLLFIIVSLLSTQSNVEGSCVDTGGTTVTDVSTRFVSTVVTGVKTGGFSIQCEFNSANSYSLYLWQLKILNGTSFDTVFSYFPGITPPTITAGPGYTGRGLTFINNNTVVFPNFTTTDVTEEDYECTIQLNSADIICIETKTLYIFTEPKLMSTGQDSFPMWTKQVLDITGIDFLPAPATFRMLINSVSTNLSTNVTDQDDGFKRFTSQVSFSVPGVGPLKVEMFMTVKLREVLFYSKSYPVDPLILLILVIIAVVMTVAFAVAAWIWKEIHGLQIAALVVDIVGGVTAFIILLLVCLLYSDSKYFIPILVLSLVEIGASIGHGIYIRIYCWKKK